MLSKITYIVTFKSSPSDCIVCMSLLKSFKYVLLETAEVLLIELS